MVLHPFGRFDKTRCRWVTQGYPSRTYGHRVRVCVTAASVIQQDVDTIRLGKYDIGVIIGLDA